MGSTLSASEKYAQWLEEPRLVGRGEVPVSEQIPLVDYLVLGDDPHLEANECAACGARFFDRRNACAACGATAFDRVRVANEGEVRAFTIVSMAAPGIAVPFVASVVDCDGTSVRANLVNVAPDPEHVRMGMKVRLATTQVGTDSAGTEAIGFGYEPLEGG
jgi:uncharacterized OB-fold protein